MSTVPRGLISGVYTHYEGGIATGATEKWLLSGIPNAFTQKDRDLRLIKYAYHVDSTIIKGYITFDKLRCTSLQYHVQRDDNTVARGHYKVQPTRIEVTRSIGATDSLEDTIPHNGNISLDPPFVCSKGYMVRHLAGTTQKPILAPLLTAGDRPGDLAKKSARVIGDEIIEINGEPINTTHYDYMRDYWLDEHGIVIKASQDNYDIILTEYQHHT